MNNYYNFLPYFLEILLRIAPKPATWADNWSYYTINDLLHALITKGWFTKEVRKELFGWDDATDDLFVRPSYLGIQLNEDAILKRIPSMVPSYEYDEDFFEERMPDQKSYQRKMQYYLRLMVVEDRLQGLDEQIGELVYDDKSHSPLDEMLSYYIIDDSEFEETLLEYCNDKGI